MVGGRTGVTYVVDVELDVRASVRVPSEDAAMAFKVALQQRLDAVVEFVDEAAGDWDKSKATWRAVVREEGSL